MNELARPMMDPADEIFKIFLIRQVRCGRNERCDEEGGGCLFSAHLLIVCTYRPPFSFEIDWLE